jgi:hypothetical protein
VVSPIGIGEFFNTDALRILASEVRWIWVPTLWAFLMLRAFQRVRLGQPAVERHPSDVVDNATATADQLFTVTVKTSDAKGKKNAQR